MTTEVKDVPPLGYGIPTDGTCFTLEYFRTSVPSSIPNDKRVVLSMAHRMRLMEAERTVEGTVKTENRSSQIGSGVLTLASWPPRAQHPQPRAETLSRCPISHLRGRQSASARRRQDFQSMNDLKIGIAAHTSGIPDQSGKRPPAFWTAAGSGAPRRFLVPRSSLGEGDAFARRGFPKRCRRCALPPQSKTLPRSPTHH
jgi:hypothetical protein